MPTQEPQINLSDVEDQKFVWVIPIDKEESNQFALKPYDQSYYLACVESQTGRVILREGGKGDQEKYANLKLAHD